MEIILVRTEDTFDDFNRKMADRYGKAWDLEKPSTFPCIVAYEIIYGNCYPDSLYCYTIEKRHFDNPMDCDAFDSILD